MLTNIYKRKGFRIAVYSVVVPILLQLFYVRYISYNVDKSFFGSYILYISFIALIASFLFSIPYAALTRYINQTNNKERFVNEFMTLQIPLNVIGIIIIYLYSIYANTGFDIFLILSIYFVLLNRYSINKIVIFQLIKRKQYFNISVLEKLARFFLPVLIFYFFQSSDGLLYGLLTGYIVLVAYSSFQARIFKQKIFFSYRKLKIYFFYAYPLLIINLAVWVVSLSDRYFIENYIGSMIVGEYSILAQVAGFSSILASIFTVYVQPIIFKTFSIDKKKAMEMYLEYLRKSLFIFIPSYVVFLFIPREVFTIIVSPEIILNDEYFYLFHILVLASIFISYVTILTNIFFLNNRLFTLSVFWLIASLLTLIGNTFIETYGIYAVALTKMFAYLFMIICMYYCIKNLMLKKYRNKSHKDNKRQNNFDFDLVGENRKLKVVYAADIGSTYRTGGGQTFARLFLEGMASHWSRVELAAFVYDKPADQGTVISQLSEEITSKVNLTSIKTPDYSIGHPVTDLIFILKARKSIAALDADLYIFDQPNTMVTLLPNKPSIAFFHGNISSYIKYKLTPLNIPRIIKKVLWQQIIVKKVMLQYLRNEKKHIPLFNSLYSLNGSLECIPNLDKKTLVPLVFGLPVDTNRFFPSDELGLKYRERNGIQNDDVVITYVSNFAQKKLPNIVPEIIAPLLENKKIRIFIIGRSMDSEILDRFCEKHYNCFRIDEIPNEDVNGYINMSDILFSTSKTETFGYTIVEGMLCSKPSVVFSEGAQVEYIDHGINGMIANTKHEFYQHLEQLVSDETLRQQLGQEARKTILKKFGLKKYMGKVSRIIEENFGGTPL